MVGPAGEGGGETRVAPGPEEVSSHASANRTAVHRSAEAPEALHLPEWTSCRGRDRGADLPGAHAGHSAAVRPAARPALPRFHDLSVANDRGAGVFILLNP